MMERGRFLRRRLNDFDMHLRGDVGHAVRIAVHQIELAQSKIKGNFRETNLCSGKPGFRLNGFLRLTAFSGYERSAHAASFC